MKFRFHALGVPHTVTSENFSACAYTQKVLKFCKMMYEKYFKDVINVFNGKGWYELSLSK